MPAAFLGGSRGLAAVVYYTADFDIDQITNKWRRCCRYHYRWFLLIKTAYVQESSAPWFMRWGLFFKTKGKCANSEPTCCCSVPPSHVTAPQLKKAEQGGEGSAKCASRRGAVFAQTCLLLKLEETNKLKHRSCCDDIDLIPIPVLVSILSTFGSIRPTPNLQAVQASQKYHHTKP